jgi:hypothetical protein
MRGCDFRALEGAHPRLPRRGELGLPSLRPSGGSLGSVVNAALSARTDGGSSGRLPVDGEDHNEPVAGGPGDQCAQVGVAQHAETGGD